jgi:hypothetical protein
VAVHIYTQTIHNITINNKTTRITNKTTQTTNLEECCPLSFTLAFALQLREKHGKTSVRVAEEIQSIHIIRTHTHITKQFKTTTVQIKTNTVQDIPK